MTIDWETLRDVDIYGESEAPVEPTPNRMRARLLTRADLADLPKPGPLIDGVLDTNTVALLAGYWGTCKSFIAQDWAACIATGRSWQGRTVVRKRVLYVAAEGAYGLDDRWAAWESAWRHDIDSHWLHTYPDPIHLGDKAQVLDIANLVEEEGYGFVILDTLAKCATGMDENSSQDMGKVVSALYTIRTSSGEGTVLGVHHTGKDKTTIRGSSAIEGGVDTVYLTEGDTSALTLRRTKRKDGPREDAHSLKLQPVEGTDSAVIVRTVADIPQSAEALMSVILSAFSETGCSKAELRNAAGLPNATFARALNALVKEGLIVNHGTEQRAYYRLKVAS